MAGPDATIPTSPGGIILPFNGIRPKFGADVFVASNAVVIGDVVVGDRANIWFNCVLRGDGNYIRVGPDTNLPVGPIIQN
jgi:carbonic anhydrase/acetyltransferase-like protein (isoleucine patch superfamily)